MKCHAFAGVFHYLSTFEESHDWEVEIASRLIHRTPDRWNAPWTNQHYHEGVRWPTAEEAHSFARPPCPRKTGDYTLRISHPLGHRHSIIVRNEALFDFWDIVQLDVHWTNNNPHILSLPVRSFDVHMMRSDSSSENLTCVSIDILTAMQKNRSTIEVCRNYPVTAIWLQMAIVNVCEYILDSRTWDTTAIPCFTKP